MEYYQDDICGITFQKKTFFVGLIYSYIAMKNIKLRTSLLNLLTVLIFSFLSSNCYEKNNIENLKVEKCPYGHTSLKSIPILYGEIGIDSTLEAALNKNEIELGGCDISDNDPKYRIVCEDCGYKKYNYDSVKTWRRTSTDFSSFDFPLNKIILEFSILLVDTTQLFDPKISYIQKIFDDKVIYEGLQYSSNKSYLEFENIVEKVMSHSTSNGVLTKPENVFKEKSNKELTYEWNIKGIEYKFNSQTYYNNKGSFINFSWSYQ